MAVLEKIRVRMGIFITVIIAVALLSFIIDPQTLQSTLSMFSSKNDVGSIDGKGISYQEFNKKIQYYTNIQQLMSGSSSMNEEESQAVNDNAWQDCLFERAIAPAIEAAGIRVGDDEKFDLVQGKEISPLLQNNPIFMDAQTKAFSKDKVLEFIKNMKQDKSGMIASYWNFLESNIYKNQLVSKYSSLLSGSIITTPIELRRNMEDNNLLVDVEFAVQNINFGNDTTIVLSKDEMQAYYDAHKHLYEQPESRDFDYLVFEIYPSLEDISQAEADANKVFDDFAKEDNMKLFLSRNSDEPFNETYYKEGELKRQLPKVEEFAFGDNVKVGDVLPVTRFGDNFIAAKIMNIKNLPDTIEVSHILIQRGDAAESKRVADSLLNVLNKGGNFEQLVLDYSVDKNNTEKPGALGKMTSKQVFPGFEPCFEKDLNKPFVLETQYGAHIVKVTKQIDICKKVQVAVLVKKAIAGNATFQKFYSEANQVSAGCKNFEEFKAYAKEHNLSLTPASTITRDAKSIGGYSNVRELVRWAFDHKVGEISPVISSDNKRFFVAALTGIHKEGVPTIREKMSAISNELTTEKKKDKLMNQMAELMKSSTDINDFANKAGVTVSKQSGVSFGSINRQQFDSSLTGAIVGAEPGKLVGPVKGMIGVYVLQVTNREVGEFYTEEDAKRADALVSQAQERMLLPTIQKAYKVVDHRSKFY